MFYTLIILVFFTLFLLINKPDNENYKWIVVSFIGFCMAIFAFIYYISCLYEYFQIKIAYFDFSSTLWLFLNSFNISAQTVSRIMNFGIVLFVFSFVNFSYLYTHSFTDKQKKFVDYKYMVLPVFFLIFYDPAIINYIFRFAMFIKRNYFNFSFTFILQIFNWLNRLWIVFYIFIGFYWLYMDYKKHLIERLRKKILYVVLCLIPVTGLYFLMFYWFPQQILLLRESSVYKSAISKHAYVDFSYGNFIHLPLLYKFYPIISIISIGILLYAIYTLKAFSLFEKSQHDKLEYSLSTAGLGAKIFSHAIKNDLYAIKIIVEDCVKDKENTSEMSKITKLCNLNIERLDNLKKVLNINSVELVPGNVIKCILKGIDKVNIPENISLVTEFEEEIMEAFIDSNYFSEVISSILQNAIDAVNSKLSEESLIKVSVKRRNKEIDISISDNGCGLSEDRVERIFDPFFSTKPSTNNWGMGLSYCSRVIQLHNGEIHFKSVLEEGSEVLICLPSIGVG